MFIIFLTTRKSLLKEKLKSLNNTHAENLGGVGRANKVYRSGSL